MLIALNQAFNKELINNLLFLKNIPEKTLALSGYGVLKSSHLIVANLAKFKILMQNGPIVLYKMSLTDKGK